VCTALAQNANIPARRKFLLSDLMREALYVDLHDYFFAKSSSIEILCIYSQNNIFTLLFLEKILNLNQKAVYKIACLINKFISSCGF
jgi:hypothetical protein